MITQRHGRAKQALSKGGGGGKHRHFGRTLNISTDEVLNTSGVYHAVSKPAKVCKSINPTDN